MKFPALVSCTVIDWFQPWPYQALKNVAVRELGKVDGLTSDVRSAIENFMPYSFESVNKSAKEFLREAR